MIYWRITVFVFAFSLIGVFIAGMSETHFSSMGSNMTDIPFYGAQPIDMNMTQKFEVWNASAQNVGEVNLGYGDVVGGISMFLGAFSRVVLYVPTMLYSLGLPVDFINIFVGMTILVLGAGLVHLWTGRNPER